MGKHGIVLGILPRYDSPNIPKLNALLASSLQDDFIGIAKTIKLCHVDKKDRVHLRPNVHFYLENHQSKNWKVSLNNPEIIACPIHIVLNSSIENEIPL